MSYKVVILGDAGVGKSNLHSRFVYDCYHEARRPTVGIDFGVRRFTFGSRQVSLQVWDTAGQERFQAMAIRSYVKDAYGVVLVYDVTNRESFTNALAWKRKLDLSETVKPEVVTVLVGNKADVDGGREVPTEEGLRIADNHSMIFIESSAKQGTNVEQIFKLLVGEIDRIQMNSTEIPLVPHSYIDCSWGEQRTVSLTLSETHLLKKDNGGCCT